jgi:hypothetical protein
MPHQSRNEKKRGGEERRREERKRKRCRNRMIKCQGSTDYGSSDLKAAEDRQEHEMR